MQWRNVHVAWQAMIHHHLGLQILQYHHLNQEEKQIPLVARLHYAFHLTWNSIILPVSHPTIAAAIIWKSNMVKKMVIQVLAIPQNTANMTQAVALAAVAAAAAAVVVVVQQQQQAVYLLINNNNSDISCDYHPLKHLLLQSFLKRDCH